MLTSQEANHARMMAGYAGGFNAAGHRIA